MKKEITREPNDILHQRCLEVSDSEEARKIANELLLAIKRLARFWNRWLGLAANQINYSRRLVILRAGRDKYQVLVNPQFLEKRMPFFYLETCYSVSGFYLVKRYFWSRLKYQDLSLNWHEVVFKGPSAIYQEIDHIDGKLVSEVGYRLL
jgi:peptide deformylase